MIRETREDALASWPGRTFPGSGQRTSSEPEGSGMVTLYEDAACTKPLTELPVGQSCRVDEYLKGGAVFFCFRRSSHVIHGRVFLSDQTGDGFQLIGV